MKLFSHNMLTSKCMKAVTVGFPLKIEATEIKVVDVAFNSEFILRLVPKLEWHAVVQAAQDVGRATGLPLAIPENYAEDETFLKLAHHILMEIEVVEGDLVCPETSRKFPIKNGIPNMLLNEDEV